MKYNGCKMVRSISECPRRLRDFNTRSFAMGICFTHEVLITGLTTLRKVLEKVLCTAQFHSTSNWGHGS